MFLRMGDLRPAEFAERVGAEFTPDELALLEAHYEPNASFDGPRGLHIFDDPAISMTVGAETLNQIRDVLIESNDRRSWNRDVPIYPNASFKGGDA